MSKSLDATVLEKRRFQIDRFSFLLRGGIVGTLGFMIGRGVIEGISPMLIAYYGCILGNKRLKLWAFLSIAIGLVSVQKIPNIFRYLLIMIIMNAVTTGLGLIRKKINIRFMGIIGGLSSVVVSSIFNIYFKFYQLPIVIIFLEGICVFLLTILFNKGIVFLTDFKDGEMGKEAYISFSLIACSAVLGMIGINIIQLSLMELIGLNLILYLGYEFGIEASSLMGVAIGFASYYIQKETSVDSFIIWSSLGIVGGLFRDIGKVGTSIAYLASFIILNIIYGPKNIDLKMIETIILTIGVFLLVANRKISKKTKIKPLIIENLEVQNIISRKLEKFSMTFEKLAKNYVSGDFAQEQITNDEIRKLIDHVADKVCKDCSMCNICWQKDFYDTYRTIYSVLGAVEKKGEVLVEDIPDEFYKRCLKVDEFVIMINRVFELYKANLVWENKMAEQRSLFADQFLNLSEITKNLAENSLIDLENKTDFKKVESFKTIKAFSNINKTDQIISGDCYTFLDLEGGRDIIALSDGMGSGEEALFESKATIEMLENLLEGGFDIDLAIKIINSVLGIRNNHQRFATLDISILNRFTGECSFIKNGAATTYLKRGKLVEEIKTDTLPLGMFKDVDYTLIKRKLKADDIVIMITDGISEASNKNDNDKWLKEEIENIESFNPQKIADDILNIAKEKEEGIPKDDMTVLVFRVWGKNAS